MAGAAEAGPVEGLAEEEAPAGPPWAAAHPRAAWSTGAARVSAGGRAGVRRGRRREATSCRPRRLRLLLRRRSGQAGAAGARPRRTDGRDAPDALAAAHDGAPARSSAPPAAAVVAAVIQPAVAAAGAEPPPPPPSAGAPLPLRP